MHAACGLRNVCFILDSGIRSIRHHTQDVMLDPIAAARRRPGSASSTTARARHRCSIARKASVLSGFP